MLRWTAFLAVFFAGVSSLSALTVCHDYTWFRLTGANVNNLPREALTRQLQDPARGYRRILAFTSSDANALAKGQRYLQIGRAHV